MYISIPITFELKSLKSLPSGLISRTEPAADCVYNYVCTLDLQLNRAVQRVRQLNRWNALQCPIRCYVGKSVCPCWLRHSMYQIYIYSKAPMYQIYTYSKDPICIKYTYIYSKAPIGALITWILAWSGFEAAKTAPWPSRGLHHFGKLLEPSDEWACRGCYCFLMRWHNWAFLDDQEWAPKTCRAQIWIFQF